MAGSVTVMHVLLFVLHMSMVSAGHECVGTTHGSGIVSNTADVLGMRGVGGSGQCRR